MPVTQISSDDLSEAFATLHHSLWGYLKRRVSDPGVAEDLLQDVFLKAQKAIIENRAPGNLAAWLFTVARTTVIDHYRARRPAGEPLDENIPDVAADAEERMHQELATCLAPLAQALPPIYRDTLLATDFGGQSMQAIADAQNLSLSAIKSRASRGWKLLKNIVLDCCHVETRGGMVSNYHRRAASQSDCGCA